MKKRKSKIRVIYHAPKIKKPEPNCPTCGKGFMRSHEEYDSQRETRIRYEACDVCGSGFDELGMNWGKVERL